MDIPEWLNGNFITRDAAGRPASDGDAGVAAYEPRGGAAPEIASRLLRFTVAAMQFRSASSTTCTRLKYEQLWKRFEAEV